MDLHTMRLPLATQLKTRPGALEKDARLTNSYAEIKGESATVRKRPGSNDLGFLQGGLPQLLACLGLSQTLLLILDDLAYTVTEQAVRYALNFPPSPPLPAAAQAIISSTVSPKVPTPTPVAGFAPETANLIYGSEQTGAAQSQQQLLVKSREQAWIYTPE